MNGQRSIPQLLRSNWLTGHSCPKMATSVLRIDVCSRLLAQNLSLDARALDRASEFAVELLNKERAKKRGLRVRSDSAPLQ